MIFIVVNFKVLPEHQENWLSITKDFTDATRSETETSGTSGHAASDDPSEYVLVEAFRDAEAGAEHVAADHFRRGLESMRPALSETPRIITTEVSRNRVVTDGRTEIAQ